jgi:hypothetical protein
LHSIVSVGRRSSGRRTWLVHFEAVLRPRAERASHDSGRVLNGLTVVENQVASQAMRMDCPARGSTNCLTTTFVSGRENVHLAGFATSFGQAGVDLKANLTLLACRE